MERELVKISVRELVEFIMRSGDIDHRTGGKRDAESMLAGAKIHRKIQRSMGSDYHAEVSLKHLIPMEQFDLQVEGRADGIIDGNPVTIDEIKGIYKSLEYLNGPVPVHLAQAKCYAYIYGIQNQKKEMNIQMTYVNLDTEQKLYFNEYYSMDELAAYLVLSAMFELLNEYGENSNSPVWYYYDSKLTKQKPEFYPDYM